VVTNGAIPAGDLVTIAGNGARLLAGPAASWARGCAEVERRFGWRPAPSGPSDAYRELAVQIATFLDRYVPAKTGGGYHGDVRWWNGVRYVRLRYRRSDGRPAAAAAVPGTSNHGKGRAVDVTGLGGFTGARYAQFASVFVPLGWSNAEGRAVNEAWHWVDLQSPETVSSGHAVIPGVTPTPGLTTPRPIAEDTLSAKAEQQIDAIYNAVFNGGPSMEDAGRPIQRSLAAIAEAVSPINRGGTPVSLRQEIADCKTVIMRLEAKLVDDLLAPINRDGHPVSVRQELADAKTILIRLERTLTAQTPPGA